MKRIFLLPSLFWILTVLVLVTPARNAFAQKVTICIDFTANEDFTESDGTTVSVTPSGLSAADQAAIVAQVQSLYEGMLGKGNVTVKNASGGVPCEGKFV